MHLLRTACAISTGRSCSIPVLTPRTPDSGSPNLPPSAGGYAAADQGVLYTIPTPLPEGRRKLSPALRHSRFQSITAAYDILRGKSNGESTLVNIHRAEIERRRRARAAYEASRGYTRTRPRAETWSASVDKQWKDRIILFVGLMALGAGLGPALVWPSYTALYQAHVSASKTLADARKEAREFGEERCKELRRRAQEYNELKAAQDSPLEDDPRT